MLCHFKPFIMVYRNIFAHPTFSLIEFFSNASNYEIFLNRWTKVVIIYVGDSDGGLTKFTDHYFNGKKTLFEIKPQREKVLKFSFHKKCLYCISQF